MKQLFLAFTILFVSGCTSKAVIEQCPYLVCYGGRDNACLYAQETQIMGDVLIFKTCKGKTMVTNTWSVEGR